MPHDKFNGLEKKSVFNYNFLILSLCLCNKKHVQNYEGFFWRFFEIYNYSGNYFNVHLPYLTFK